MRYRASLDDAEKRDSSIQQAGPLFSVRPYHQTDKSMPAVYKYKLTPWSRTVLQNLIVPELVKKFPSHKPATCPFPEPDEYSPPTSPPPNHIP